MISLSFDPILLIIFNLTDIHDVINLSNINKNMLDMFDNNLYTEWGRNLYTREFWNKAGKRSLHTYKHYISMKIELLRICKFQNNLLKYGYEPWNKEDFYKYWQGLEQVKGRAPLKPHKGENSRFAWTFKTPFNNNYTNEEIYAGLDVL
jgi:hypothetical protein